MDIELIAEAEARLGTAIEQCVTSGLLTRPIPTQGYIEAAIEPVAAVVFDLAAAGQWVEVCDVLTRLGLTGQARGWAAKTLEREIESGDSKRQVFAPSGGLLVLDQGVAMAAAFRAAWNPFERIHEDDAKPEAESMTVYAVAKNLARRGEAVFGYPITAAEAALATMQGYRLAGIRVSRDAWTSALDGARAGDREAEAEARHRQVETQESTSRVVGILQGLAA